MVHVYSVEKLIHYRCGRCDAWWSKGDGRTEGPMSCPECQYRAELKPIEGKDDLQRAAD